MASPASLFAGLFFIVVGLVGGAFLLWYLAGTFIGFWRGGARMLAITPEIRQKQHRFKLLTLAGLLGSLAVILLDAWLVPAGLAQIAIACTGLGANFGFILGHKIAKNDF